MTATTWLPWRVRVARTLDAWSVYLPVVLIGALALASYGLLRLTPDLVEAPAEAPVSSAPDFFMRGFRVQTFEPGGALRSEVNGREARHLPATGGMEIDDARIRQFDPAQGVITQAEARRVVVNDAHTEYLLEGEAVVLREALPGASPRPRLSFRGERLRIVTEPTERIESDRPVEILRGSDRLRADRLVYAGDTRVADLQGRVRAQIVPRSARPAALRP